LQLTLISNVAQGGHDAGDHPPITPIASATEAELGGGDDWRLYDYIARHFLGSLSPDCVIRRTTAAFTAGHERFSATGVAPVRAGFTAVMPWKVRLYSGLQLCRAM
jgi:DNA topoisomerase-3